MTTHHAGASQASAYWVPAIPEPRKRDLEAIERANEEMCGQVLARHRLRLAKKKTPRVRDLLRWQTEAALEEWRKTSPPIAAMNCWGAVVPPLQFEHYIREQAAAAMALARELFPHWD